MSTSCQSIRGTALQRWHRSWGWAVLLMVGGCCAVLRADVSRESKIKAAFLYNFTKFVEWPADRFADDSAPIVIGVAGPKSFSDELEKVVLGRAVNGHALQIVRITSRADAARVHVLYVAAEEAEHGSWCAEPLAGVLTVGETDAAVIVAFTTVGDKVRFEIDAARAERAGLKLSSQLLKLASVVRRAP